MILTNCSKFFQVVVFYFAQFSSFPECISLPVPKSLCPTFGSFLGTFDFECCLDEYRCPIAVNKSILDGTILQNSRVERSPIGITAKDSSPDFSEIHSRRTRTLNTLEVNLCEVQVNTIQPSYGTLVKSGEKIQILQIPVLTQTVVQYTCSGESAKLIRGNCVQQYKPEELYTVSTVFSETGESSVVIKRDFVKVEAGCQITIDLTSFIPELSEKRKTKIDTVPSLPTIEITPVVEIKKQTPSGSGLSGPSNQESLHSFLTHSSSINENRSSSVELGFKSVANSNPKFTSSFSNTVKDEDPDQNLQNSLKSTRAAIHSNFNKKNESDITLLVSQEHQTRTSEAEMKMSTSPVTGWNTLQTNSTQRMIPTLDSSSSSSDQDYLKKISICREYPTRLACRYLFIPLNSTL